jgi:EAL and modified HD-GYP domain-containing signal transduction protein
VKEFDLGVARQPILDRRLRLVGYELLFRGNGNRNHAGEILDHRAATASVIVNGFLDVGLPELVGEHRAWVNVTRDFLLAVRPLPLPADRLVLELLEGQEVDEALLDVLDELVEEGFTIALDDFALTPDTERLLEFASVIKVDVLEHRGEQLHALVAELRRLRPGATLLAEKVETREEFDACRELGFQAFQGYFFAKPSRLRHQRLPSQGLSALSSMAQINQTEDFDELHRIIERDAGLSIRLLRYTNSAYLYLPRRIGSVHEGLLMLGAINVRRFALMVALAGARDAPSELLVTALVRARMCQLLSGAVDGPDGDSYFTVGLFSVADALIDAPMEDVLKELPFREDIAEALVQGGGRLGDVLAAVTAYERGDFVAADAALPQPHPDFEACYRDAVKFADENIGKLL